MLKGVKREELLAKRLTFFICFLLGCSNNTLFPGLVLFRWVSIWDVDKLGTLWDVDNLLCSDDAIYYYYNIIQKKCINTV